MKKTAVLTIATLITCSVMSVTSSQAQIIPINCPIKNAPCERQQHCNCGKPECPKCNKPAPVFNSCEEIQNWRIKFCEKRVKLYNALCLTQEQRVKAKCIDDKFFDEIAPLKLCCKQEKAKLEDMKCKKCKRSEIREQKQKVKDLKSEIKEKKKQHKECFMELLTCQQKEKYKELKKDKCHKHKKNKCDCGCK